MKIKQVILNEKVRAVRQAVTDCKTNAMIGNRQEAYAAAERCQDAAFELKQLFMLTPKEIDAAMKLPEVKP